MTTPSDPTLSYYDQNAQEFVDDTKDVDMRALYPPFLSRIPKIGKILDLGCGSGRDSRYFLQAGFKVTAIDGSMEMIRAAKKIHGIDGIHMRIEDIKFYNDFDGIWACASLLHIPKERIGGILSRIEKALVPGGILYASFKYGTREEIRDGRLFSDFTEETASNLFSEMRGFALDRVWKTEDSRKEKAGQWWLNVLARKLDH